jgi:hypothetical protein
VIIDSGHPGCDEGHGMNTEALPFRGAVLLLAEIVLRARVEAGPRLTNAAGIA